MKNAIKPSDQKSLSLAEPLSPIRSEVRLVAMKQADLLFPHGTWFTGCQALDLVPAHPFKRQWNSTPVLTFISRCLSAS